MRERSRTTTSMMMMMMMMMVCVAEAAGDMNVCFILDGVLILYGIVLTVLYCRLRMVPSKKKAANLPQKQSGEAGIYEGLTTQSTDVYETIKMEKPPAV